MRRDAHPRGQAHRRPRHADRPPDLVRGGPPPARPRLGALHRAARRRRSSPRRSAPRATSSGSTRLTGERSGSASCSTTTSRPSRRARRSRCAAPAGARSATARSPSARCARMLPPDEKFPYTIRIVSEILESNGSVVDGRGLRRLPLADGRGRSNQAAPVAGIAMGLIKEEREDRHPHRHPRRRRSPRRHGLQGLRHRQGHHRHPDGHQDRRPEPRRSSRRRWSRRARAASTSSAKMVETLAQPRADCRKYAPRITTIKVKPDQIRDIIGPGGKTIKGIIDQTGVAIDIEDDGTVNIASPDGERVKQAIDDHPGLTQEAEVGKTYTGTVQRITDFGAFVEIFPGTDGLVHISDIANTARGEGGGRDEGRRRGAGEGGLGGPLREDPALAQGSAGRARAGTASSTPPRVPRRSRRGARYLPSLALFSLTSTSTTEGSARVEMSPRASNSSAAILRRMRRMILPERVLGRPGAQWMTSGCARGRCPCARAATSSVRSESLGRRALLQGHVRVDALPLISCGKPDHGGLGDVVVRDQRALDLGGAEAVAADVDDVVDAAGDPVVAVLVAAAAVAGEVEAGEGAEVRLAEAIRVAVDAAHDSRPGRDEAEVAGAGAFEHLALVVHHHRLDAEERQRGRAGLLVDRAGQRRDQDAAGLRLPPGVHHRAAPVADHARGTRATPRD